jgi:magnesium transporter
MVQEPQKLLKEDESLSSESDYGLNVDMVHFITSALEEGDSARVRELAADLHSADVAELLNQISSEQRIKLAGFIKQDFDPEIFPDLEGEVVEDVIGALGSKRTAKAISQLESDDAMQVIEDLDEEGQQAILEAMPRADRAMLEEGLAFEEDSAGRLMNRQFVSIPRNWTVGKTIDFLRNQEDLPNDFYEIFVVDKDELAVGSVLVSRVIRSARETKIKDIYDEDLKTVALDTDQEEVGYLFQKYNLASAPVVDDVGHIVGVISLDDVVYVIEEEAEEDFMRLGGVSRIDLNRTAARTAYARFPWLFVNLLTAIAASVVIALFEGAIEKIVALAVMMPIVASMGGNAGTQSLTIAVRALATKELTSTNVRRIIGKEMLSAFINGISFAVIVAAASYLYQPDIMLSLVFAGATLITLCVAGCAGVSIPIVLMRMGVDPAIASGVFLTTVTDIVGFFTFLGLAAYILL